MTLAVVESLLVQVADERFSIPLSIVQECAELTTEDIKESNGRHLLKLHGELVPYVRLRERFQISGEKPEIEQAVIISWNDENYGLIVDRALDKHPVVIKSLSKVYKNVDAFTGATILGDGSVALVIDVNKLLDRIVEQTELNPLTS